MSRILLGVTGGIAAYKACELTRLLVKAGHEVIPLVTPGAQRFVTEETFLALARRPRNEDVYPHLTRADLLVVAPCTANTLAKLAHGIADNVLTEAALAHRGPDPRRAGDEPAHVGERRRRARTSRRCARAASSSSAPTRARWPRASGASAGSPSRRRSPSASSSCSRPGSLAGTPGPHHRRRDARAARQRPLPRQPLLGPHGRRARRGGAPPRRRGDPARREPLRRRRRTASRRSRRRPPSRCCDAALALPDVDVAAARRRRRRLPAGRGARRQAREGRAGAGRSSSSRPTTSRRRSASASAPGQVLVAFGAEHGAEGLERKRAMLETKNADLVVFNDVGRSDIGFDSADNEVVLVARDGERAVAEGARRPRSPPRSSTRSRGCSP